MSSIFLSALRLSETEQLLQYPKFSFVVFCSVLAAGLAVAGYRQSRHWSWLPAVTIWSLLAFALVGQSFTYYAWMQYGGAGLLGAALALALFYRRNIGSWAPLSAVPGIIALLGGLMINLVGVLP